MGTSTCDTVAKSSSPVEKKDLIIIGSKFGTDKTKISCILKNKNTNLKVTDWIFKQ